MKQGHPPRKEEIVLYGHRMAEWQQVRPLAQWMVFFDPVTKIAYSHTDYFPEDFRGRLLRKQAFESHSQRAYFIVENNELNEYKGLTLPYSDEIVPASGQPRGLLLKEHGEREARPINDIAKRGGNVKAEYHDVGMALDYEHAIYRDEIPAIKENIKIKSEDRELLNEAGVRFRDLDVFFGGEREILRRCQECFKLTYEDLMVKVRFLRENISLSVGIPVFELLAHLNIGFYEDTLKKVPIGDQRRIIEAFIDNYCSISERQLVKENVFSVLAQTRKWTEAVSGFVANPENPKFPRQIPSEFILNLWDNPPLKL